MTPRRLTIAALSGLLALGTLGAASATAEPTRVSADDDYVACLAVDIVLVGSCVRNPVPDVSHLPSPGRMVGDLLPTR